MKKCIKRKEKGFTLVELLAVIAILGLILIIAVPKINKTMNNSKKRTFEISAKSIAKSAEERYIENETYGINEEITCESISNISKKDFSSCKINFDDEGNATVTIVGAGSYEGFNICGGTKTDASAINEECSSSGSNANTGANTIAAKVGTDGLVQTYATVNGEQVDAGIRYAGPLEGDNAVKNRIYFNCKDEYTSDSKTIKYGDEDYVYEGNCEVWRIIGVFNTKSSDNASEKPVPRIKIVRDAFSTNMSWDSSSRSPGTENNYGYGINQWGDKKDSSGNTIYEGADLMRMLNGYYIGESSTCTYCNANNQGTCPTTNNCANIMGQISSTSLKMVDDALWYTGATAYADPLPLSTMYGGERSTQSGKICSSGDYCNDNVTRTTTWVGKIGLIYPSDYAYASTDASCASDIYGSNSTCNVSNWLHPSSGYYWTITSYADSSNASVVWFVYSSDRVISYSAYSAYGVRPALYLASNVQIIGGDGTDGNAYRLSIDEQ